MSTTSLNGGASMRTVSPRTGAPVTICGAGPVGLAMAIELARHGIRSTVFERHPGTAVHPKARYLNTRTLEMRQWDPAAHAELVALDWPRR